MSTIASRTQSDMVRWSTAAAAMIFA